jgi:hypothetical protein
MSSTFFVTYIYLFIADADKMEYDSDNGGRNKKKGRSSATSNNRSSVVSKNRSSVVSKKRPARSPPPTNNKKRRR